MADVLIVGWVFATVAFASYRAGLWLLEKERLGRYVKSGRVT